MLKGKKTFAVGLGMMAFGALGWVLGIMDPTEAGRTIMEGAGFITLRLGIASSA